MAFKDITGKRFGYLTVIKRLGSNKHQQMVWECLCDCGKTTKVVTGNLTSGKHKGCGCRISAKGANNYNWKGGIKKDTAGYVYLYAPTHPAFQKQGLPPLFYPFRAFLQLSFRTKAQPIKPGFFFSGAKTKSNFPDCVYKIIPQLRDFLLQH